MARGTIVSRTLKGGEKRYYAALWTEKPEGGREQLWRTFDRKREAEAFLDDQSRAVRDQEYFQPSKITFKQFAEEWLAKYPKLADGGLKDSTFAVYHNVVHKHLVPFGSKLLSQIKAATIEKDFKSQLGSDLAPKTIRNIQR